MVPCAFLTPSEENAMEEMEIREATVLEVRDGKLLVRMDKPQEEECGGCRACTLKSLCHDRSSSFIDIEAAVPPGSEPHRPGDRVRIAYRSANPAVAALVLFLPSLIGLCAGGFLANRLAGQGDGIFLAGTGLGVLLGVGATYLLGLRSRATVPQVMLVQTS